MSLLNLRLKNCIQTILELEPGLKEHRADIFESDFTLLRNYLKGVDKFNLVEEDVARLENVTSTFLEELGDNWTQTNRLLQ